MISQPNIVIQYPEGQGNQPIEYFEEDGSPIKRFDRMFQVDAITYQYLALFAEQNDKQIHRQKSEKGSEQKRMNMGVKIKNKLQNSSNKSSSNKNNLNHSSQVNYEILPYCDEIFEGSQSGQKKQTIKNQQQEGQLLATKLVRKKKLRLIKSTGGLFDSMQREQNLKEYEQSHFGDISAKTHKNSLDGLEFKQNSPVTPIDNLNSLSSLFTASNHVKLLDFNKSIEQKVSQFKYKEKKSETKRNINVKNVPLTSSQCLLFSAAECCSPASFLPSPVKVKNVQSVCLPYSSNKKQEGSNFQFVLKQFQQLKENVEKLEGAIRHLQTLKSGQSSVELPSRITYNDSANKMNQSFYQLFQNHLEGIVQTSQAKTILIEASKNEEKSLKRSSQFIYQTPNHAGRNQQQLTKRKISEKQILEEQSQIIKTIQLSKNLKQLLHLYQSNPDKIRISLKGSESLAKKQVTSSEYKDQDKQNIRLN